MEKFTLLFPSNPPLKFLAGAPPPPPPPPAGIKQCLDFCLQNKKIIYRIKNINYFLNWFTVKKISLKQKICYELFPFIDVWKKNSKSFKKENVSMPIATKCLDFFF